MSFIYADDRSFGSNNSIINNGTDANGSHILGLMGSGMSVLMRSPRFVRFPKGTGMHALLSLVIAAVNSVVYDEVYISSVLSKL